MHVYTYMIDYNNFLSGLWLLMNEIPSQWLNL